MTALLKHLPGQHEQDRHAGKGGRRRIKVDPKLVVGGLAVATLAGSSWYIANQRKTYEIQAASTMGDLDDLDLGDPSPEQLEWASRSFDQQERLQRRLGNEGGGTRVGATPLDVEPLSDAEVSSIVEGVDLVKGAFGESNVNLAVNTLTFDLPDSGDHLGMTSSTFQDGWLDGTRSHINVDIDPTGVRAERMRRLFDYSNSSDSPHHFISGSDAFKTTVVHEYAHALSFKAAGLVSSDAKKALRLGESHPTVHESFGAALKDQSDWLKGTKKTPDHQAVSKYALTTPQEFWAENVTAHLSGSSRAHPDTGLWIDEVRDRMTRSTGDANRRRINQRDGLEKAQGGKVYVWRSHPRGDDSVSLADLDIRDVPDDVNKHLPGQHEQDRHAGKGGRRGIKVDPKLVGGAAALLAAGGVAAVVVRAENQISDPFATADNPGPAVDRLVRAGIDRDKISVQQDVSEAEIEGIAQGVGDIDRLFGKGIANKSIADLHLGPIDKARRTGSGSSKVKTPNIVPGAVGYARFDLFSFGTQLSIDLSRARRISKLEMKWSDRTGTPINTLHTVGNDQPDQRARITAVHEWTHAVDFAQGGGMPGASEQPILRFAQKKSPYAYKHPENMYVQWHRARGRNAASSVSVYSRLNGREFLAENVAAYATGHGKANEHTGAWVKALRATTIDKAAPRRVLESDPWPMTIEEAEAINAEAFADDDTVAVRKDVPQDQTFWRWMLSPTWQPEPSLTPGTPELSRALQRLWARLAGVDPNNVDLDALFAELEARTESILTQEAQKSIEQLDKAAKARVAAFPGGTRPVIDFDIRNPHVIEWARQRAGQISRHLHAEATETIRRETLRAVEIGAPPQETAFRLERLLPLHPRDQAALQRFQVSQTNVPARQANRNAKAYAKRLAANRALTVARTEQLSAQNSGLHQGWLASQRAGTLPDDAQRAWVVSKDCRLCPSCRRMVGDNAKLVGLHQPFHHPTIGEVWNPPLHPRCRCTTVLVSKAMLSDKELDAVLRPKLPKC